jgi:Uma2 family endonuclease
MVMDTQEHTLGTIPEDIVADAASLPTEDDLPYEDGEPMETPRHRDQMNLLIDSLRIHWADRHQYFVGGNMFLYYDPNDLYRFRGPDFFLVLDVADRERKSWVVWREGMRFPDVIIELLSDKTRHIDKGEKKQVYEQVFRTPEYYLYDPYSQEFAGYQLVKCRYTLMETDAEGRYFSSVTGLYLGVQEGWLRWITPEGSVLPTGNELAEQERQRAEQERQRAEQERQRAEQAIQALGQERQRAEHAEQAAEQLRQQLEAYRRRFGAIE